jgi:hypothetical protein
MKKLLKTLAVVVLCSAFTSAIAAEPIKPATFKVGTYAIKDTEKIKVLLEKSLGSKLSLSLKDESSQVLYSEVIGKNKKKYNLNLDLADLKPGKYTLIVSNGPEKFTKSLEIIGLAAEVKTSNRLFAML